MTKTRLRMNFLVAAAMSSFLMGCAHSELRHALKMGPFESTSIEHLQAKAKSIFPIGIPSNEIQQQLGKSSKPVPPVLMLLTLRPWPFKPWSVWDDNGQLRAESEEGRNWIFWGQRRYIGLSFRVDDAKRLRSLEVWKNEISL